MKLPNEAAGAGAGGLASPAIVVILVLVLGATVYLWRARYLRSSTAYSLMAFFALLLIVVGALIYTSRV